MEKDKELLKVSHPDSGAEKDTDQKGNGTTPVTESPVQAAEPLPADLPAAYRKLAAEKQELYDRLLRKQAELENFRKRLQREKEDFLDHATANIIRSLLPVLDGFERALKHRDSNVPEQFHEGVELIYRQLMDVLTRAGLAALETEGKLFDPHYHQAVESVEAPGRREHEIVEELQRGYKLKARLLRPAIVKVAAGSGHRR